MGGTRATSSSSTIALNLAEVLLHLPLRQRERSVLAGDDSFEFVMLPDVAFQTLVSFPTLSAALTCGHRMYLALQPPRKYLEYVRREPVLLSDLFDTEETD